MAGRDRYWIEQARANLALARTARDAGSHEWACFGFPAGKPADYFTREDSDAAIADADLLRPTWAHGRPGIRTKRRASHARTSTQLDQYPWRRIDMSAVEQQAFRLFWNTEHIISNEQFDAELVKFPGWESTTGLISTRELELPDEIIFEADFSVTRHSDYPVNNVNWPLMSRRMLDTLVSLGEFAHRVIPVRLIDDTVPDPERRDADGRLRPEVVDDRFVALQLTRHIDAFDRERSEYEADDLFPDEIGIVRKLVLRTPSEGLPPLFRLAEKPNYLFVSSDAKQRMEQEGIEGAVFWSLDKIRV